jgi:predicted Zn-dependent protease
VKDLKPPDIHYFNAAQGWLGLNSAEDAQSELDKISAESQTHLLVMELRWQVCAKANRWEDAIDTARAITAKCPKEPFGWIHLSYALHELKRTADAYNSLFKVVDQFPKEWLMRYNMACYAVQLGQLDEGKDWLNYAYKVGDKEEIDELVASDVDLEPLRRANILRK